MRPYIKEGKDSRNERMRAAKRRSVVVLFIIGDWKVKVGSHEIPGVTGKYSFGVQNETGRANRVFPREHTGHSKHPLPTTQEKTTHGHHQRVNTEIRLILFFAVKDGEALSLTAKNKINLISVLTIW